jgi:hypothetical protein
MITIFAPRLGGGFQLADDDVDDDDDVDVDDCSAAVASPPSSLVVAVAVEEEGGGGANMRANIRARSRRLDVTILALLFPAADVVAAALEPEGGVVFSYILARVNRKGTIPFMTMVDDDEEDAAVVVT